MNVTVVPIGGFTQWQKIEDAAWTFETVLKAEVEIAALLDRDYRCNEEIEDLLDGVRKSLPHFHVLGAKEIENYLLCPHAISRAVQERLKDRDPAGVYRDADEGSLEHIEALLASCTEVMKSDVHGQLIAYRMRFYSGRSAKDPATVVAEAVRALDEDWCALDRRLQIVPGKQVLSSLNVELQRSLRVSVTAAQIIRHMSPDEIGVDLQSILADLEVFAGGG